MPRYTILVTWSEKLRRYAVVVAVRSEAGGAAAVVSADDLLRAATLVEKLMREGYEEVPPEGDDPECPSGACEDARRAALEAALKRLAGQDDEA